MDRKQFLISGLLSTFAAPGFGKSVERSANPQKKLEPFYIPPDDILTVERGVAIRVKVRSSQTDMQYSCVDVAIAPRAMGPAPHVHEALDELMYVCEGTVNVMVGDKVYEVKEGGWHFRPRGIPHTFWNATDKHARSIDMYFNQNFEDFLEELFFKIIPEMKQRNLAPNHPEVVARMVALDKKFGITTFPEQRQAIIEKYGLIG
jgi:mannose-6-phosphate isomerase-like protein (cupin superfamily)